jgi:N-acyl amino acid synthase of PEP-CTERM/exosortase system
MKSWPAAPVNGAAFPGKVGAERDLRPSKGGTRLLEVYDRYFEIVLAETDEQRRAAFRLRYAVYCVEHPFEDPTQNPGGLEIDAYDASALHALLLHRASQDVVGTVRLILPRSDNEFPIRHVCQHELIVRDNPLLPWAKTAEISRFAVSRKFRRRAGDKAPVGNLTPPSIDHRRQIPNTSLGLMQAIVWMAAKARITHLCALMEPTLLRMLRRLGIHFVPIGPEVDYHGRRQPCYSELDLLLSRIWVERPEVWEVITRDGGLWPLNRSAVQSLRSDEVSPDLSAVSSTKSRISVRR